MKGLAAFSRVDAGWMFSQDFYRDAEYRAMGLESLEDVLRFAEGRFGQCDANDLLAMLWTWVRDNEIEVGQMPNAELRPIPSTWGHAAGRGGDSAANRVIDAAIAELLAG